MKTINYLAVLTFLILFLTSCSKETIDVEQNKKDFTIVPLKQNDSRNLLENYKVINYGVSNNKLDIEITIPTSDYSFVRSYNISTLENPAILYLLTRNSTENIKHLPVNYIIQDRIDVSEYNLENNNLTIFVMNNSEELSESNITFDCIKDDMDMGILEGNCGEITRSADGPKTYNGSIIID
jgi:hypothetical protein